MSAGTGLFPSRGGGHITADDPLDSSDVHNAMIPRRYSVALTGVEREDGFSQIGIGPLGLIVELEAERTGDH